MKCTWLYTGNDGRSHFAELEIPAGDGFGVGADFLPAINAWLTETPTGRTAEMHSAARRQLFVVLSGVEEIECGDGTKRQFRAGDLLLADDTTGEGHITRDIKDCRRIFVSLSDSFDPNVWRVGGSAT